MPRIFFIISASIMLLAFVIPSPKSKYELFKPIKQEFYLHWKTKTGVASFRTNVLTNGNDLIVGSNGDRFMDYNLMDQSSGVYIINRKDGKIKNHFGEEVWGDMDVNGVLVYNNYIYFGNDNEEFMCCNRNGKIIWRNPESGDIEHEPVLLDIKGAKYIVYASESGEVKAVNPETGATFWSYYTPEFDGWKHGQNRNIFKVKSYFSSTNSFFTKPCMKDINADGIKDLVYLTFDNMVYAISGSNGKLLWLYKPDNKRLNYILTMSGSSNASAFLLTSTYYNSSGTLTNDLISLNQMGVPSVLHRNEKSWGYREFGLNTLLLSDGTILMPTTDSLMIISADCKNITWIDRSLLYENYDYYYNKNVTETRNSREALLGNQLFTYKGDSTCAVLLGQYDPANSAFGVIEIISLKSKKLLMRLSLESGSEMPPVISDINQDGSPDLLVNCRDGYTYCYGL